MQVSTAEFKKGLKIQLDGEPYSIVDFQHVKPGKGGAFVRTKLKHMRLGRVIDNTFRAGEKVELVDFEERRMQYLYKDDRFHFMDLDTYETITMSGDMIGDDRHLLADNLELQVHKYNGNPIGLQFPPHVHLRVASTEPGVRGDTASGGVTKLATLETGLEIRVPLFIKEGETVKVHTETREFAGRA